MKNALKNIIRTHKFRQPWTTAKDLCEKYLRAYYNEANWDFSTNGEQRVLQKFALHWQNVADPKNLIVFDVGANKGQYSKKVLEVLPESSIYCFEPLPELAKKGADAFADVERVQYFQCALSSESGIARIYCSNVLNTTNTICPRLGSTYFPSVEKARTLEIETKTGDGIIVELGLKNLHLLKVDVEGHEVSVLRGFASTLASKLRPLLIQFEYGETYIPARHSLLDIYTILEKAGYSIGRVYPNCVRFKSYEWGDDHFRMGNYVAVLRGSDLETMLATN